MENRWPTKLCAIHGPVAALLVLKRNSATRERELAVTERIVSFDVKGAYEN
jgi:hypothetical protein